MQHVTQCVTLSHSMSPFMSLCISYSIICKCMVSVLFCFQYGERPSAHLVPACSLSPYSILTTFFSTGNSENLSDMQTLHGDGVHACVGAVNPYHGVVVVQAN